MTTMHQQSIHRMPRGLGLIQNITKNLLSSQSEAESNLQNPQKSHGFSATEYFTQLNKISNSLFKNKLDINKIPNLTTCNIHIYIHTHIRDLDCPPFLINQDHKLQCQIAPNKNSEFQHEKPQLFQKNSKIQ